MSEPSQRTSRALSWTWYGWIAMCLLQGLLYGLELGDGWHLLVLVLIHATLTCAVLLYSLHRALAAVVVSALILRLSTAFLDVYAPFDVPYMGGGDAAGFLKAGLHIANDLSLAGDTYGGVYTGLMGYLFWLIGPYQIGPQYTNVLFGVSSILLLIRALELLNVRRGVTVTTAIIAAFAPGLVFHSSVLLREAVIQFLVTGAFVCFLISVLRRRRVWTLPAVGLCLIASTFHAGVVGVLIGFIVVGGFTYFEDGRFKFGFRGVIPMLPMAVGLVIVVLQNPDLFLAKFATLETADDVLSRQASRRGGSAYLTGQQIDGWFSFVIYAPLRALYFIASPVPLDWRGLGDALVFLMDSLVYLSPLVMALTSMRKGSENRRMVLICLLITLVCVIFVFGAGVANSGTALRHRTKIAIYILTLGAVAFDKGSVANSDDSPVASADTSEVVH